VGLVDRLASRECVVVLDSALFTASFWLKFENLNLKQGSPVKKLALAGGKTYRGNAMDKFVDVKLFTFADLTDIAPKKIVLPSSRGGFNSLRLLWICDR
jgi:hypothetical protein